LQFADQSIAQMQSDANNRTPPLLPTENSLPVEPAPSEAPLQSANQSIAQMQSDANSRTPPSLPISSCSRCHRPWIPSDIDATYTAICKLYNLRSSLDINAPR
jgi:hypothetical protein